MGEERKKGQIWLKIKKPLKSDWLQKILKVLHSKTKQKNPLWSHFEYYWRQWQPTPVLLPGKSHSKLYTILIEMRHANNASFSTCKYGPPTQEKTWEHVVRIICLLNIYYLVTGPIMRAPKCIYLVHTWISMVIFSKQSVAINKHKNLFVLFETFFFLSI